MRSGSSRAAERRGRDNAAALAEIDSMAKWLDARFNIFGIRFGLDSLLGLVPALGDGATAAIGLYILARAARLGAPFGLLVHMAWNLLLDTLLGAIPLVGDVFDLVFRANLKNVRLLRRHLEQEAAAQSA